MVTYPIHVKRNSYRGAEARKKIMAMQDNRDATAIEQAANRLIQSQTVAFQIYTWGAIARESGVDADTVRRLGFSIDGGSNGFTAIRPGLSQDDIQRALKGEIV